MSLIINMLNWILSITQGGRKVYYVKNEMTGQRVLVQALADLPSINQSYALRYIN